jgi:hypothetical protein
VFALNVTQDFGKRVCKDLKIAQCQHEESHAFGNISVKEDGFVSTTCVPKQVLVAASFSFWDLRQGKSSDWSSHSTTCLGRSFGKVADRGPGLSAKPFVLHRLSLSAAYLNAFCVP